MALVLVCGGIAILSFVLAQIESPSWQAVISIIIVLISIAALLYSIWQSQDLED